jgi:hypothetical protein
MKHSAKAVAKLAREREKQASRAARPDGAGGARDAGGADGADGADSAHSQAVGNGTDATAPVPATATATATAAAASPASPAAARPATAIAARSRAGTRRLAQLPYAVVVAGILVGLGVMRGGAQDVKGGTLVMAGALLAGSLARLLLPESRVGLLGSRRRLLDAAALTALGVGLLIAGLIVKVPG